MLKIIPQQTRIICLTDYRILKGDAYQYRLKIAMANLSISRRTWPDYVIDTLYDFGGKIICPDGRTRWPVPCVAEVFGDPRWISYFLKHSGMKIRRLDRLEVLDAVFQIKHPTVHQHFIR